MTRTLLRVGQAMLKAGDLELAAAVQREVASSPKSDPRSRVRAAAELAKMITEIAKQVEPPAQKMELDANVTLPKSIELKIVPCHQAK